MADRLRRCQCMFQYAFDLCFRVPEGRPLPWLPTLTLLFEGAEMEVAGERLLYRAPGERHAGGDISCFASSPPISSDHDPTPPSTIGYWPIGSVSANAFSVLIDVLNWANTPEYQENAAYIHMVTVHKSYAIARRW